MATIKMFQHTGRPQSIGVEDGDTVGKLRARLGFGALTCHVNGYAVTDEQELRHLDVVVFSGQVTGG